MMVEGDIISKEICEFQIIKIILEIIQEIQITHSKINPKVICTEDTSFYFLTRLIAPGSGRIIPRPLPILPPDLQILQELTLKLGDFSTPLLEDYISNVKSFAEVIIMKGSIFLSTFSIIVLIIIDFR
jgi:hypothetical protein